MRRPLELAALGAIQGAAELLPVSSSAHVALVPRLLGWEVASLGPAQRKELEVALHAGAAVALAPELLRLAPDLRTLALALAPPVAIGYALERPIEERFDPALGLVLGAIALAAADRRAIGKVGSAAKPPPLHALALGVAQAAALAPGVSRTGATLAAARALGYSRAQASRLSFGVAGPVLVGATALKAWRARRGADPALLVGACTAFVSARVALRVLGTDRVEPWWPYAAERCALALLAASRR